MHIISLIRFNVNKLVHVMSGKSKEVKKGPKWYPVGSGAPVDVILWNPYHFYGWNLDDHGHQFEYS